MGPFPHDAPPAKISADNPAGTDGFEFVEFAHPEPDELARAVRADGLCAGGTPQDQEDHALSSGRHQLSRQRASRALIAVRFVAAHGPCAPSMACAWSMRSTPYERAVTLGAEPADIPAAHKTLDVPAIKGIGGIAALFRRPLWRQGLGL